MRSVLGMEKLEAVTGRQSFLGFSFVNHLKLSREEQGYSLTLVLENDGSAEKVQLTMNFTQIRDLRLCGFGGMPTQITGFDVRDISSTQVEDIGFEVVDFENDCIQFFCKSAEIKTVEKVPL